MSDTFTTRLGLRKQQTGGNDNTWGDLLNSDVIDVLDEAIAGVSAHGVTGGTLDLSASPLPHMIQRFTGTLTSDQTVTLPSLETLKLIVNSTTGAFSLLLTIAATTVEIPQGTSVWIRSGGTGVTRLDGIHVGKVEMFAGVTVPAGTLECDGAAISRTSHPDLFTAIGTTWGAGNGVSTFNLPDVKTAGRFLRSRTGSVAVGTLQAADTAAHSHTASGAFTGTLASFTPAGSVGINAISGSIAASITGTAATGTVTTNATGVPLGALNPGAQLFQGTLGASSSFTFSSGSASFSGNAINYTPAGTVGVTVDNSTGTETRPINASVLMVIRY